MKRTLGQTYVSARFRALPKTRPRRVSKGWVWVGERGPEMVMPLNVSISVKSTPSPNDLLRLLADYKKRNPRNPT